MIGSDVGRSFIGAFFQQQRDPFLLPPLIQRRKNCALRLGELYKMTVGSLLCSLDPSWNVRDIVIVGDETDWRIVLRYEPGNDGG